MNNQPALCPQHKMKARGVIFAFSLIALIFYVIYFLIYLVFSLPSLEYAFEDVASMISLFLNIFGMIFTFLGVLFFFLFSAGLYKGKAATVIFPLSFLFLLISALISLVTCVFSLVGGYLLNWEGSPSIYGASARYLVFTVIPAFVMVVMYLLATLNAFRVFKGIVIIVLTMTLEIVGLNMTSVINSTLSYSDSIVLTALYSFGMIFFFPALIIYVSLNGVPGSPKKFQ